MTIIAKSKRVSFSKVQTSHRIPSSFSLFRRGWKWTTLYTGTGITPETGQRRDYGPFVFRNRESRSRLAGVRHYVVCVFRSPVAGLSLRRFAFLFLSFSRSRRPLALSLAPRPSSTLSVRRARPCSRSLFSGLLPGSLSSPVRASNPSWTKVLPAPCRAYHARFRIAIDPSSDSPVIGIATTRALLVVHARRMRVYGCPTDPYGSRIDPFDRPPRKCAWIECGAISKSEEIESGRE